MALPISSKPARSDEVPVPDEQARVAAAVRAHFDASAPKRAPKPGRSEPGGSEQVGSCDLLEQIPEEQRLRQLAARSEPLVIEGGVVNCDEYQENEYYRGLDSVVRSGQHYTTGAGFIPIEKLSNVDLVVEDSNHNRFRYKSNPATNDWEPTAGSFFVQSQKPSRSDP